MAGVKICSVSVFKCDTKRLHVGGSSLTNSITLTSTKESSCTYLTLWPSRLQPGIKVSCELQHHMTACHMINWLCRRCIDKHYLSLCIYLAWFLFSSRLRVICVKDVSDRFDWKVSFWILVLLFSTAYPIKEAEILTWKHSCQEMMK